MAEQDTNKTSRWRGAYILFDVELADDVGKLDVRRKHSGSSQMENDALLETWRLVISFFWSIHSLSNVCLLMGMVAK